MVASTFSTIGLPVASDVELDALAQRLHQLAERVHAPNGEYFRWSDPSGAEAWLQVNAAKELIGINPHFAGRSTIQVGLTARLARPGYERDGSFHGWADPAGDAPDTGCYPFVFDAPEFRLHEELSFPTRKEVQIAAFAHEITAFETVAAYEASQTDDLKYASQFFIPTGLFSSAGDSTVPAQARAMLAGHVLAADEKINVLTGHAFYWALVETFGGSYDLVMHSSLLSRAPAVGGVVAGSFWLSGRIIEASRNIASA